jgi:quinol monooxygenase YgiN
LIIVAGHLTIDPAHREAALEAIATNVAATRAEDGNLDYRFSPDLDEPGRFNIIERWESEEAMSAHLASPHLGAFLGTIGGLLGGPAEVIRYDVSGSSKLF